MSMAIMELESTSPTCTLLEELRKRMTTWEPAATTTSTSHRVVRVFPGVEAAFQICKRENKLSTCGQGRSRE
jgi:hypothetical protein